MPARTKGHRPKGMIGPIYFFSFAVNPNLPAGIIGFTQKEKSRPVAGNLKFNLIQGILGDLNTIGIRSGTSAGAGRLREFFQKHGLGRIKPFSFKQINSLFRILDHQIFGDQKSLGQSLLIFIQMGRHLLIVRRLEHGCCRKHFRYDHRRIPLYGSVLGPGL